VHSVSDNFIPAQINYYRTPNRPGSFIISPSRQKTARTSFSFPHAPEEKEAKRNRLR
jgi:hypothetical protein